MQHSNPSSFWFTAAHCPSAPQSHAGFIMTHKDSNIDRCTLPGRKYWQMSNVGRPPHMRPPCSITITWFWPKSNTFYRDSFYMDLIILVDDENSNSQWANIWFRNMYCCWSCTPTNFVSHIHIWNKVAFSQNPFCFTSHPPISFHWNAIFTRRVCWFCL